MNNISDLLMRVHLFHCRGAHNAALDTAADFMGDWRRVDGLGIRLGHTNFNKHLIDNIFYQSPLLFSFRAKVFGDG